MNWLRRLDSCAVSAASLDYANENAVLTCKELGVPLLSEAHRDISSLLAWVERADIVLIHFWNHPLLYDFLVRNPLPPARVVFWAHASGFHPPYIFPEKILNYADKFVFTTPASFFAKEIESYPRKDKLSAILSTSGVERFATLQKKPHDEFNIGYVGTVDYAKMHPDFLKMCASIHIPNVKFIVISNDSQETLKRAASETGMADKFYFAGKVADVWPWLEVFDVFGYPLNPNHYGTAEQVLQEAMAAGVVPVVLDNRAERGVLGECGVIAKDTDDYARKIEALYNDDEARIALGEKAREYALSKFTSGALFSAWDAVLADVVTAEKHPRHWVSDRAEPLSHYEIFLESLGKYAKVTENLKEMANSPLWMSRSKGTPFQYAEFFPEDRELARLCHELLRPAQSPHIYAPPIMLLYALIHLLIPSFLRSFIAYH
ncbi:hypothetical protein FACS1894187_02760 [Synergistales bacterium]|nr:hypothetical protein FACS1894187_02760 [Synergistales bacterium]